MSGELREAEGEILARRPEHAIEPTLERMAALVSVLGDPQRSYPVIHITGTNGKTSTARMIESLLRARGLRTGLFTSPHLSSIRERIVIDGQLVSAEAFVTAYEELAPYLALVDGRQASQLSFFEVLTGMAFAIFADVPVDVAIVEVGLGGTWDATNIADGAVAVVTPVSLDHTAYLGGTVEEIAADKAGIIKPGAVAVLAQQSLPAAEALLRRVVTVGASVVREGLEFGVLNRDLAVGGQRLDLRGLRADYTDIALPLFGAYQASNAAVALAAVEAFATGTPLPGQASDAEAPDNRSADEAAAAAGEAEGDDSPNIDPDRVTASLDADESSGGALGQDLVRAAFAQVTSPGRLEVVRRSPVVVLDAAHNPAGMEAAMEAVTEAFTFAALVGVLAVSADKDVPGILDQLEPVISELVVTRNSSDRSMDPGKLAEVAASVFGPERVHLARRLDDALEMAVGLADDASGDEGLTRTGVLVTGSVITAGDARALLAPDRLDPDHRDAEYAEPDDGEADDAEADYAEADYGEADYGEADDAEADYGEAAEPE
ncbi:MAG: folylpolyglutamate synthase/dihydrofolate synthase family protein [Streptosporangiaceae bacterium]